MKRFQTPGSREAAEQRANNTRLLAMTNQQLIEFADAVGMLHFLLLAEVQLERERREFMRRMANYIP
jgi:hypothetical protein